MYTVTVTYENDEGRYSDYVEFRSQQQAIRYVNELEREMIRGDADIKRISMRSGIMGDPQNYLVER